jgi:hypothetical protein
MAGVIRTTALDPAYGQQTRALASGMIRWVPNRSRAR